MISPKPRVDRNEGTAPGSTMIMFGLVAIPLISWITHQPDAARYVGSTVYTIGVLWVLVVTSVADRKNGEAIVSNFFIALAFCCIPLYCTLSALGVVWWLRLVVAVVEGLASFILFRVIFHRTVSQIRRKKLT